MHLHDGDGSFRSVGVGAVRVEAEETVEVGRGHGGTAGGGGPPAADGDASRRVASPQSRPVRIRRGRGIGAKKRDKVPLDLIRPRPPEETGYGGELVAEVKREPAADMDREVATAALGIVGGAEGAQVGRRHWARGVLDPVGQVLACEDV